MKSGSTCNLCVDALFVVDREARQKGMSSAERLALRREHAMWVNEIRETCLTVSRLKLPQSALGKAAASVLKWRRFSQSWNRAAGCVCR